MKSNWIMKTALVASLYLLTSTTHAETYGVFCKEKVGKSQIEKILNVANIDIDDSKYILPKNFENPQDYAVRVSDRLKLAFPNAYLEMKNKISKIPIINNGPDSSDYNDSESKCVRKLLAYTDANGQISRVVFTKSADTSLPMSDQIRGLAFLNEVSPLSISYYISKNVTGTELQESISNDGYSLNQDRFIHQFGNSISLRSVTVNRLTYELMNKITEVESKTLEKICQDNSELCQFNLEKLATLGGKVTAQEVKSNSHNICLDSHATSVESYIECLKMAVKKGGYFYQYKELAAEPIHDLTKGGFANPPGWLIMGPLSIPYILVIAPLRASTKTYSFDDIEDSLSVLNLDNLKFLRESLSSQREHMTAQLLSIYESELKPVIFSLSKLSEIEKDAVDKKILSHISNAIFFKRYGGLKSLEEIRIDINRDLENSVNSEAL